MPAAAVIQVGLRMGYLKGIKCDKIVLRLEFNKEKYYMHREMGGRLSLPFPNYVSGTKFRIKGNN